MDAGHRPGKVIGLSAEQLQSLAAQPVGTTRGQPSIAAARDDLSRFIDLVKAHDVEALRTGLSQTALRMGLERFVKEISAPLNTMVGEAWACGGLEVFEEHLYTESMQVVLRNAIGTIPSSGQHPRVLLTTFPNEVHGLGLLMAEALLALDGCRCASLGTQTPVWDIVRAASVKPIDIVALSFSACLNANQILDGLTELRAKLPATIEVWAGGQCPVLLRRPPANVAVLPSLSDIAPAVRRWRIARQAGGQPEAIQYQATNSDSTPV
jgi:methanogenic corrinoid protein MtbC1